MWCMNDVIHEGMPRVSFTISFNCLADLVYNNYVGILLFFQRRIWGFIPRKISPKTALILHFMDFVRNLDSHTGPDSKYN